jgi:pyrimidine-nucleoside phosphorylase
MTAYEIISKKRDGFDILDSEIAELIEGFTKGIIPDYQMAAFLMATFLRGMNDREIMSLTKTMMQSGEIADLSSIPGIKVDKHSTGGVGDKVSIILAPIVAAAGVPVPMISGRGLGHSGGTLDKLESIPGFRVDYSLNEYRDKIKKIGVCLIGQTPTIVPADKKMYALRDVTATVQSIPLITASIMSKKMAEGIDALVLDVKTGKGAFMQTQDEALQLAKQLIAVGEQFNKPTIAYITDMNEPLGMKVGNWLEIEECIDALNGKGPDDLMEVTHQLCGTMIHLGKKAETIEKGIEISKSMIQSAKAKNKFLEIVEEQNGNTAIINAPESYPKSKFKVDVQAESDGYIQSINALDIGLIAVSLGAGRMRSEDVIDPKAGIAFHKKSGLKIKTGEPVLTFYTDKESIIESAKTRLARAVKIGDNPPDPKLLIIQYLDKTYLE